MAGRGTGTRMIPSWYGLILLGLAAFRTWKLIGDDTILDRPRAKLLLLSFRAGGPKAKNYVEALLECPWCAGFWISLLWWGAFMLWPHGTVVASVPLAIAAIVGLLGNLISD
jgi:hypothetical protein